MIRSMTAWAGGERSTAWGTLSCELRSVNHRFLEIGLRLPDDLRAAEAALRERISARLNRGKIDAVLRLRAPEGSTALAINHALVEQLGDLAGQLRERFPAMTVSLTELLQYPGVVRGEAVDPLALQAQALALLDEVLDGFIAAREREGEKLAAAIAELKTLDHIRAQKYK